MPCHDHTIHLFTAKGGQGCTTIAACLALYTAEQQRHVVVYDAAPNRELAAVCGLDTSSPLAVTERITAYHYDHDSTDLPAADIVDWGTRPVTSGLPGRRLLVVTSCYLALSAVRNLYRWERPDAVVFVDDRRRALDAGDVEAVVGAEIVATVGHDPAVARAVDAGMLAAGPPRAATAHLRHLVSAAAGIDLAEVQ